MSVKSSALRLSIDSLLVFRASGLATVAASNGSANPLTLDVLTAYWNAGDDANSKQFAIQAQVESISAASGSPTATFSVRVDNDAAFGSATTIESAAALTAAGTVTILVSREQIEAALVTQTGVPVYLDVYMTIGGGATTPAVAWNAYASPLVG